MASSGNDQQQQRPDVKSAPLKWPIKREDYELLEVIGNCIYYYTCIYLFNSRKVPLETYFL